MDTQPFLNHYLLPVCTLLSNHIPYGKTYYLICNEFLKVCIIEVIKTKHKGICFFFFFFVFDLLSFYVDNSDDNLLMNSGVINY